MPLPCLIDQWFPVFPVGEESVPERKGSGTSPIANLHTWFGRKPLTASRAAVVLSMLPAWPRADSADPSESDLHDRMSSEFPQGEGQYRQWVMKLLGFRYDPSGRAAYRPYMYPPSLAEIDRLHKLVRLRTGRTDTPVFLDHFAGGGAIPFEAARYGFTTLANDANPVAVALLHGTLTSPFKHRGRLGKLFSTYGKRWADRVEQQTAALYPQQRTESGTPTEWIVGYVWALAVPCPQTGFPTPLASDSWLVRSARLKVAVRLRGDRDTGRITREVVTGGAAATVGATSFYGGGRGLSLFTGDPIPSDYIKSEARGGRLTEVMLGVITTKPSGRGKVYRAPTDEDLAAVEGAKSTLASSLVDLEARGLIPTEPIEPGDKTREPLAFGFSQWRDLFTPRQLLAHSSAVSAAHQVIEECREEEGAQAAESLALYLGFAVSKCVTMSSRLASWNVAAQVFRDSMGQKNLTIMLKFAEAGAADRAKKAVDQMQKALDGIDRLLGGDAVTSESRVQVFMGDAAALPIDAGSVDAMVVDPPYSNAVAYAELSDLFYVWLKRSLSTTWPQLAQLHLSDKRLEVMAPEAIFGPLATHSGRGQRPAGAVTARELAGRHFEERLLAAFKEAHRVLADDGVMTVMFTHSGIDTWDQLGVTLLDAGFSMEASWPVPTEGRGALQQLGKNSVNATIFMSCRKRSGSEPTYWSDIKPDIAVAARRAASQFSEDGLVGIDLTVSTFGPVLSVLSRNWPVYTGELDDDGSPEVLRPDEALDLARQEVAMLKKRGLLGGKNVEFDRPTDWYLLAWHDFQAEEFPAGEARKLSLATHLELDDLIKTERLAKSSGGFVTLLTPRQRRTTKALKTSDSEFPTLIDTLHALMVVYDEDGLKAAREWMDRRPITSSEKFIDLFSAVLKAIPRVRKGDEFAREEARVLESLRLTVFPQVEAPAAPTEQQVLLQVDG